MAILDTAEIMVDFEGNLAYLTPTKLWIHDIAGSDMGITGTFSSGRNDLGEPHVDKLLNFIEIDYIGQCTMFFTMDTGLVTLINLPENIGRSTRWLNIPLSDRKPFQKFSYSFSSAIHGTIIYDLEIDFSIIKKRRYN